MSIRRLERAGRIPLIALRLCGQARRGRSHLQIAVACLSMIGLWVAVGPGVGFAANSTPPSVGGRTSATDGHRGLAPVGAAWHDLIGYGNPVDALTSLRPPITTTTTGGVFSRRVLAASERDPLVGSIRDPTVDGESLLAVAAGFAAEDAGGSLLSDAARACDANSFTATTLVTMADGSKRPISRVLVGDLVRATVPQTGETAPCPVTGLIVHSGQHVMVNVTLADGSMITATDHHPLWDATTSTFTYADRLHVGDDLVEADGAIIRIAGLRIYQEDVTAYNLTVDGVHTYYRALRACWCTTVARLTSTYCPGRASSWIRPTLAGS